MIAIGLDGCRGGWVLVRLSTTAPPTITAIRSVGELSEFDFNSGAIDMPIGLPERGNRDCDTSARRYLGKQAPRVFPGVRRGLLVRGPFNRANYDATNVYLHAHCEAGIALQLWNILPKVLELDRAMRPDLGLRRRLRESHPELVFRRLNNNEPVPPKKDAKGISKRIELLHKQGLGLAEAWLKRPVRRELTDLIGQPRMSVGVDDILDACACAIAARQLKHSFPEGEPLSDSCGLPMQIWF